MEGGGVDVEMLMSLTTGGYKSGVACTLCVVCSMCYTIQIDTVLYRSIDRYTCMCVCM